MAFVITKGTTGYVNPAVAAVDTGWSISGKYAIHVACNAGSIKAYTALGLVVGRSYVFTYTVDNYSSGGVNIIAGTANGVSRDIEGTYTETLTVTGNNQLSFFSDGNLRISELSFYDNVTGLISGTTLCFNEKANKWTGEYSAVPEVWIKFLDNLFSIKNGQLWLHDANPTRNNFYNTQYTSRITFYVNINEEEVKNFYTMRQRSTTPWTSANDGDINIIPYMGKANGQLSRLKKANFQNLQGDFFAKFLRDLSDPRFNDTLTALFQGAVLQGKVMEITMENGDITTVRLVGVDVETAKQNFTY